MIQFIENHFVGAYYPTIESTFSRDVTHNGVAYQCEIIDTAGQVCLSVLFPPRLLFTPSSQDEYSILNAKHAIGIHGYVLVYSISSRRSFDMIKVVYDKIIDFCGKTEIPCVIVGTKCDLSSRCALLPSSSVASSSAHTLHSPFTDRCSRKKLKFLPRANRLRG